MSDLDRTAANRNDEEDAQQTGEARSAPDPQGAEDLLKTASDLAAQEKFSEAVNACNEGLKLASFESSGGNSADTVKLEFLLLRSSAYTGLGTWITSQSSSRSEMQPFYGQDPSFYALKAKEDATAACDLSPSSGEALLKLGDATFLLEEYEAAEAAYEKGLELEPTNEELKAGLDKATAILGDKGSRRRNSEGSNRGAADPSRISADGSAVAVAVTVAADAAADGGGGGASGATPWDSDLECTLCMEMLYEPVTTPCGHTFCQGCFYRAMDHNNRCPMCRVVLHVGRKLPVTVTLKSILKRSFPELYEARRAEHETAAQHLEENGPMPLFVMSLLMPYEKMGLNVFEPRYRLMIRRCMEGNRRFGMAKVDPETGAVHPVACQVEITECQSMPDGRYGIEIVGRRRFRMAQGTTDQDGYRVAQPTFFGDDPLEEGSERHDEATAIKEELDGVMGDFIGKIRSHLQSSRGRGSAALHQLLERANEKPEDGAGLEAFSFWAASMCVFSESERMKMIASTDTVARLQHARDNIKGVAEHSGAIAQCIIM